MIAKVLEDIHFQVCKLAGHEIPWQSREVNFGAALEKLLPRIKGGKGTVPLLGSPEWVNDEDVRSVLIAALSWALLMSSLQEGQLFAARITAMYQNAGFDVADLPWNLRMAVVAQEPISESPPSEEEDYDYG